MSATILQGNAVDLLRTLPNESVHCVVTSPPYWGLRDYGVSGQIGLEDSLNEFISRLRDVFREVHRVLRFDGTCWINMGDSYASNAGGYSPTGSRGSTAWKSIGRGTQTAIVKNRRRVPQAGLKPKDLIGQPWRLAFALQDDGWYLRQDIIWHKPCPMPESVRDRCTKAHEYLFLLTKSERYFWNFQAMQEPVTGNSHPRSKKVPAGWAVGDESRRSADHQQIGVHPKARLAGGSRSRQNASFSSAVSGLVSTRNRRSVWKIGPEPFSGAHFATFPRALVRPCILAGCPDGGTVLDPFGGSGTTAVVALETGRKAILCELNPDYVRIAQERIAGTKRL